jgi:hypothetical protein
MSGGSGSWPGERRLGRGGVLNNAARCAREGIEEQVSEPARQRRGKLSNYHDHMLQLEAATIINLEDLYQL